MCKTRVLDLIKWPKTAQDQEIDALARVLRCQKRAPQKHKNKNSCSRSSFWLLNGHFGGPRGAENSTFTVCLSRFCKKPKTGKTAQKVNYSGNSGNSGNRGLRRFRRNNARIRAATGGTNRGGPPPEETPTA